jgi:hypothetical protein
MGGRGGRLSSRTARTLAHRNRGGTVPLALARDRQTDEPQVRVRPQLHCCVSVPKQQCNHSGALLRRTSCLRPAASRLSLTWDCRNGSPLRISRSRAAQQALGGGWKHRRPLAGDRSATHPANDLAIRDRCRYRVKGAASAVAVETAALPLTQPREGRRRGGWSSPEAATRSAPTGRLL